jgi:predicted permease
MTAALLASILFAPLPYGDAGKLSFVQETNYGQSLSYPDAERLSERVGASLQLGLAAFDSETLTNAGEPRALQGAIVSANYFDVLRVALQLGTAFSEHGSQSRQVVISDRLWHSNFGGDKQIVGRVMRLNDVDYTIVGVAPRGFLDASPFGFVNREFWTRLDPLDPKMSGPNQYNFVGISRPVDGSEAQAVNSAMIGALRQIASAHPKKDPDFYTIKVSSLEDRLFGSARFLLWGLYASVTLVFIAACVNLANLQLARNSAREIEFAIKSSLGATRWDIAADLFAEIAILGFVGMSIGVLIAVVGLHALSGVLSSILPRWDNVGLTVGAVVYAIVLVPLTAALVGFIPVIFYRSDPAMVLKGTGGAGERRSVKIVRSSLVVAQNALAVILIVAVILGLRSYVAQVNVPLGFSGSGVIVALAPTPIQHRNMSDVAKARYEQRLIQELKKIPGVAESAGALQIPYLCCASTAFSNSSHHIDTQSTLYSAVTADYFNLLQIPLLRGRLFNADDKIGTAPVAIVDRLFADRYFGGLNAIGQRLTQSATSTGQDATIVGIVDVVREQQNSESEPMLYLSANQAPGLRVFLTRFDSVTSTSRRDIAQAFLRVDAESPTPQILSYADILYDSTSSVRTIVTLLAILAVLATGISLLGVYSALSYSVNLRKREFAIRRVLGASALKAIKLILLESVGSSTLGILIGLSVAATMTPSLAGLFRGISPYDPTAFGGAVIAVLLLTGATALAPALSIVRFPLVRLLKV